jgi:hypothetical protein
MGKLRAKRWSGEERGGDEDGGRGPVDAEGAD